MPKHQTPELAEKEWREHLHSIGALYDYQEAAFRFRQMGITEKPPHVEFGGVHSDGYVHLSILGEQPFVLESACTALVQLCANTLLTQPEWVIGMGMAAQQVAHCAARVLGSKMAYTERKNGRHIFLKHFPTEGTPVILARGTIHDMDDVRESAEAVVRVTDAHILSPIFCIVNRTGVTHASVGSGTKIPIRALVDISYQTWSKDECPLCKEGSTAIRDARNNWLIFRNAMHGIVPHK